MIDIRRGGPVTFGIVALCTVIELTLQLADYGVLDFPRLRQIAYWYGGFWPGLLDDWRPNYPGQPVLMFLTYGFLHSGFVHLVVNMSGLAILGVMVTERVGEFRFTVIYAVSILGGGIGYAFLASGLVPMVGASGALFGLVGAVVTWGTVDRIEFQESLSPVWRFIAIFVALNLITWWAMGGHLAWQTHLGGFLAGGAAGFFLDRATID